MSVSDGDDDLFHHAVYEQSYTELRSLKARLPEDVVVALAREVLRRLADQGRRTTLSVAPLPDERISALADALICADPKIAAELVRAERGRGAADETIYLGYLAPAARMLGDWWSEDKVSFAQVTTASGRIYAIIRSLRPNLATAPMTLGQKSALFASVPEETHTLGVKMAADLLRTEGWDISLQLGLDHDTLVEHIAASNHLVIGLSAGGAYSLANLAKLVVAIRAWAPKKLILVSGQIVEEANETVALMAPDAMAVSLEDARDALNTLWDQASQKTKTASEWRPLM